jgi:peptidoglycan/xylan/chitin deacetylase (PgdA/CDA1 family)
MWLKMVLRNGIGWLLASLLILLGFRERARQKALQPNIVTAIALHNPPQKLFRKIVVWLLRNGFVFISSAQLIEILDKKIPCPRGAVWISLDDGWKGNMDNVIPISIQYNVPVTIFICTGAVEDGAFWWRKVRQSPELLPARFRNTEAIRQLPEDMRKEILKPLEGNNPTFRREAMTIDDIRDISLIPQVTLGAHSATHPILPNCTEEQLEHELTASKRKLEEWAGKPVTAFAYPNGVSDGRERGILKANNYELAATAESASITLDSDRYYLPRNEIVDKGSTAENLCHILGIWQPIIKKMKSLIKM